MNNFLIKNERSINNIWDKLGILASIICVIHCLFLPFILIFLSLTSLNFLSEEFFHPILAVVATLIGIISLWNGYRHHTNFFSMLFSIPGIVILLFSAFNPYHILSEDLERQLTFVGAVLLSTAHGINWHKVKKCECCPQNDKMDHSL